jgi:uncharacterized protein
MVNSTSQQTHEIAWFELPADNSDRAKAFYGGLFGWSFQPSEQDYNMTFDGGGAVYGAQGQRGLLAYFGVDDLSAMIDRVKELGGQANDPQEVPGFGTYSVCTDTEGNTFGLLQRSEG